MIQGKTGESIKNQINFKADDISCIFRDTQENIFANSILENLQNINSNSDRYARDNDGMGL